MKEDCIYRPGFDPVDHAVNTLGFYGCCSRGVNCTGSIAEAGQVSAIAEHTIKIRVRSKWRTICLCDPCFKKSKYSHYASI